MKSSIQSFCEDLLPSINMLFWPYIFYLSGFRIAARAPRFEG